MHMIDIKRNLWAQSNKILIKIKIQSGGGKQNGNVHKVGPCLMSILNYIVSNKL